jgi:hypothetical protein
MNDRKQCPTCGRIDKDWANPNTRHLAISGAKSLQRDPEDRLIAYRTWRRTIGRQAYVNDVDQLEWRAVNGQPRLVAILELTRVDGESSIPVPPTYFTKILDRFTQRDGQRTFVSLLSKGLGIPTYIVLFRKDLSEFWVCPLAPTLGKFIQYSPERYKEWLLKL